MSELGKFGDSVCCLVKRFNETSRRFWIFWGRVLTSLACLDFGFGLDWIFAIIPLPHIHHFTDSSLHALRTFCGYRHGIFTIRSEELNLDALGDFLSQPDTVLDSTPHTYDAASWQITHQLTSCGHWPFLPLAIGLSYDANTTTSNSAYGTKYPLAIVSNSHRNTLNGTAPSLGIPSSLLASARIL